MKERKDRHLHSVSRCGRIKLLLLIILRKLRLVRRENYKALHDYLLVEGSSLMDVRWYLQKNPDVEKAQVDPVWHYLHQGWRERREPGPNFNGTRYLEANPDVRRANINPLIHFMQCGHYECRPVFPGDRSQELRRQARIHANDISWVHKSPLMDASWYLASYPEVKESELSADEHYYLVGWKKGYDPGPFFDTRAYLEAYADVCAAGACPLVHYERNGRKERRHVDFALRTPQPEAPGLLTRGLGWCARLSRRGGGVRRILVVSHEMTYTGAPLSLLRAVKSFREMGFEIVTVTLKDGPLRHEFEAYGPCVVESRPGRLFVEGCRADFVIINTLIPWRMVAMLGRRVPLAWWIREPPQTLMSNRQMRRVFRAAQNVYTMSEMSRDEFLPFNKSVKVIKHGMDDRYRGRKINANKVRFVTLGAIAERKGFDVFVRAVNALPPEKRALAEFSIIGSRPSMRYYNSLVELAGGRVKFVDEIQEQTELDRIYEEAACVVIPSRAEPTSRVAIEAMMMGRPVIMSDAVGAKYLLDGENGDIFPTEDHEALARLLERIIDQRASLQSMGQAARQSYLRNNAIPVFEANLRKMVEESVATFRQTKPALVHLHLFYHDQLDYFLRKLSNLHYAYDLWVTVIGKNSDSEAKLKAFKPDVHILRTDNRGYDVWPFLDVLSRVNLTNYEFVLKLHTKNFRTHTWALRRIPYCGFQWRNDLVNPLIGTRRLATRLLRLFRTRPDIGLIGAKNLFRDFEHPSQVENTKGFCQRAGLGYRDDMFFVCGTMFAIRADIADTFKQIGLRRENFDETGETGASGTLAHSLETLFGMQTLQEDRQVYGVQSFGTWLRRCRARLSEIIEKAGRHVPRRRFAKDLDIVRHSSYFDARWYLSVNGLSQKDDAAQHYLSTGWKQGLNPGPRFSTSYYLRTYADVAAHGLNPLVHFERNGRREGRGGGRMNYFEIKKCLANATQVFRSVNDIKKYLYNHDLEFDNAFIAAALVELIRGRKPRPSSHSLSLSIVIPVYNAPDDVRRLLASMATAKFSSDTQIILVDDCSQKETETLLRSEAKARGYKYLRNRSNSGFIKTCNRGIAKSSGDIVVLLNSDTEIPTFFEERIKDCFASDEAIGFASTVSSNTGWFDLPYEGICTLDEKAKMVYGKALHTYPLFTPEGFCFCCRRSALKHIGCLDEIFGRGYCEEDDLIMRAFYAKYRCVLVDDLFVKHKRHASFSKEARDLIFAENLKLFRGRHENLQQLFRLMIGARQTVDGLMARYSQQPK